MSALIESGLTESSILEIINTGQYYTDWYSIAGKATIDNFLGAFNTPVVGASGAIYGILVAFGMSYPNSELFVWTRNCPLCPCWWSTIRILNDVVLEKKSV